MIDSLVNRIKNAWEGAKKIVSDLGDGIKGWFAEKLGIHSPSRVFKGYGVNVVEGLAIGMDKAQPLAQKASDSLSEAVSFDGSTKGSLFANYQPLNRNAVTNSEINQGCIVVHFSPNITLTDNTPQSVTDQLQSALKMGAYEFEQLLNQVLDQRQRRAY